MSGYDVSADAGSLTVSSAYAQSNARNPMLYSPSGNSIFSMAVLENAELPMRPSAPGVNCTSVSCEQSMNASVGIDVRVDGMESLRMPQSR